MIAGCYREWIQLEDEENQVCWFTFFVNHGFLQKNSCLAHIINLVTQVLISTYSKTPHYDPKHPDAHIPTCCDEVGLIWAIVVKVCIFTLTRVLSLTSDQERSSSKQKEMWRTTQIMANQSPVQLILDMKVRWSLTYLMLDRAKRKKDVCNKFQWGT